VDSADHDADQQRSKRRTLRRWPWFAIAAILLATLETILFVIPPTDDPTPADAIVMFDGPGDRIDVAWALADMGYASYVVVSIDDTSKCTPERPDIEQICVTPDPPTTRGEARAFAEIARERGWDHLIAISTASQSVRARLRLGRCFDGDVEYVTAPESFLDRVYRVVYENGALPKALVVERDC
jgi:hypothetical protein